MRNVKARIERPIDVVWEFASVALLPIVLALCALLRFGSSSVLIFCTAIASIGMLFASWESSKPAVRQIMPVAVLSALAAAGRIVFAAAPNIQPVTAICIISGATFGRREGFMTGALAAFVSNCFLGQGIWTPWQMYAWGLVGYLAGVIFSRRLAAGPSDVSTWDKSISSSKYRSCLGICIFGFFASYLFSLIMDTWTVIGFGKGFGTGSILAIYAAGLSFDTLHAISTVVFLTLLYPVWEKKLVRIRLKYGLSASRS